MQKIIVSKDIKHIGEQ